MDGVAPEGAILSSSTLNPEFSKVNSAQTVIAVNVGFTFDSSSTHCGTDKLALFAIKDGDLVNVFEQILNFSCNGEKKERSLVTVDSVETKGFKDLLVTTGKKVQRYKWNGETYSK